MQTRRKRSAIFQYPSCLYRLMGASKQDGVCGTVQLLFLWFFEISQIWLYMLHRCPATGINRLLLLWLARSSGSFPGRGISRSISEMDANANMGKYQESWIMDWQRDCQCIFFRNINTINFPDGIHIAHHIESDPSRPESFNISASSKDIKPVCAMIIRSFSFLSFLIAGIRLLSVPSALIATACK